MAAVAYVREEMTNMRLGMFLELATTIGAISGAFLTSIASESSLRIVFGVSLIYAATVMLIQSRRMERSWDQNPNDNIAETLNLGGSYHDAARDEDINYGVSKKEFTFGVSYIA